MVSIWPIPINLSLVFASAAMIIDKLADDPASNITTGIMQRM
jgi:hypothetical protein